MGAVKKENTALLKEIIHMISIYLNFHDCKGSDAFDFWFMWNKQEKKSVIVNTSCNKTLWLN